MLFCIFLGFLNALIAVFINIELNKQLLFL